MVIFLYGKGLAKVWIGFGWVGFQHYLGIALIARVAGRLGPKICVVGGGWWIVGVCTKSIDRGI